MLSFKTCLYASTFKEGKLADNRRLKSVRETKAICSDISDNYMRLQASGGRGWLASKAPNIVAALSQCSWEAIFLTFRFVNTKVINGKHATVTLLAAVLCG